jgi:hypothetical protein
MNNNTPIYTHCPEKQLSMGKKLKYSFFSALIFFFISSPIMYQLMNRIHGHLFIIANEHGCPSNSGLLLHTFLFFILIFITMIIS